MASDQQALLSDATAGAESTAPTVPFEPPLLLCKPCRVSHSVQTKAKLESTCDSSRSSKSGSSYSAAGGSIGCGRAKKDHDIAPLIDAGPYITPV